MLRTFMLAAALASIGAPALARSDVDPGRVRAHLDFLAGPELRGRGSATPDEAVAAAYVAAQMQGYGLKTGPGMNSYLQRIPVLRQVLAAPAELLIDGTPAGDVTLLRGTGGVWGGKVAVLGRIAPGTKASMLVVPVGSASNADIAKARTEIGANVTVVAADKGTRRTTEASGGRPSLPMSFPNEVPAGRNSTVAVGPETMQRMLRDGANAMLSVPFTLAHDTTTNAVAGAVSLTRTALHMMHAGL